MTWLEFFGPIPIIAFSISAFFNIKRMFKMKSSKDVSLMGWLLVNIAVGSVLMTTYLEGEGMWVKAQQWVNMALCLATLATACYYRYFKLYVPIITCGLNTIERIIKK
jgi:hypothetical protein